VLFYLVLTLDDAGDVAALASWMMAMLGILIVSLSMA